ncbi:MAG: hypothetical protein IJX19_13315 [Clostridia bacterium]|nr:hypothetical protein [Clostridia bacterium]
MKKKLPAPQNQNQDQLAEKKVLMARLLANCVAMLIIYFVVAIRFQFGYIFHIYVALGVVLGLSYVIYNKGFSAKDVTPDMLPDTMSQAEKQAFIEDGKLRLRKSRWMLTLLLPIILTIACDMFYLFVIEGFLV